MSRTINLKRPAICADCGADLPAGTRARYYGPRKIYGTECHSAKRRKYPANDWDSGFECEGQARSYYDPSGAYATDGTYLGKTGPRCEDAPCCGCCP